MHANFVDWWSGVINWQDSIRLIVDLKASTSTFNCFIYIYIHTYLQGPFFTRGTSLTCSVGSLMSTVQAFYERPRQKIPQPWGLFASRKELTRTEFLGLQNEWSKASHLPFKMKCYKSLWTCPMIVTERVEPWKFCRLWLLQLKMAEMDGIKSN